MKAWRLHDTGLSLDEIEAPDPGPDEVVVQVRAAALTRDELTWPTDRLPAIPSYELAGVTDAGVEVIALLPFDRDGCLAELVAVRRDLLAAKPPALSAIEGAALPMPGLTAWQGLFDRGRLAEGERALVLGARGGVGHVAVQLARWKGAEVVEDGEADLAFDTRGTVKPAGASRYVTVAGETGAGIYFVVEPSGSQLAQVAALAIRPEIDSVFPFAEAPAAFERLTERGKRGKVVVDVAA